MSNMSQALMVRDRVLKQELAGKSRVELLELKKRAEERERYRISNVDWDDCFVSSSIDQSKIAIINQLLDTRTKRDFTNTTLNIDGYIITILESNKQHYHVVNSDLRLDVDYYGCCYGRVTGKGAIKYQDELEEINNKVRKYIKHNMYVENN